MKGRDERHFGANLRAIHRQYHFLAVAGGSDRLAGQPLSLTEPDNLCNAAGDALRPGVMAWQHSGTVEQLGKEPHLSGKVALHITMVVQVVLREIGKGRAAEKQTVKPILIQPMARRLDHQRVIAL